MARKRTTAPLRLLSFPAQPTRQATKPTGDHHYDLILGHLEELRSIAPGALEFVANVTRTMTERMRNSPYRSS